MNSIQIRLAVLEEKYITLLDRVIKHMDKEEDERQKDRQTLKEICDLMRYDQERNSSTIKKETSDVMLWANDRFATKIESAKIRATAAGISVGISLAVALIGIAIGIKS